MLPKISSTNVRNQLVQLMFRVQRRALTVEKFCSEYETLYNFQLDREDLSKDENELFARLFKKVSWYSPYTPALQGRPELFGDEDILATVRDTLTQLDSGLADVPQPVDFLAEWGLEPFESDRAQLHWEYRLHELEPDSNSKVSLSFCGTEGWLRTFTETDGIQNTTAIGQMKSLEFVETNEPMKALVGIFSAKRHLLRLELRVFDGITVNWNDKIYFP